jgi:hypothetical protein
MAEGSRRNLLHQALLVAGMFIEVRDGEYEAFVESGHVPGTAPKVKDRHRPEADRLAAQFRRTGRFSMPKQT